MGDVASKVPARQPASRRRYIHKFTLAVESIVE